MKFKTAAITTSALTLLATGCATPLKMKSVPWAEATPGQTLLLMSYELKGESADVPKDCVMNLRKSSDHKLHEFPLDPVGHQALLEASAETFKIENLACKSVGTWNLKESLRKVPPIKSGQINYIGHFIFRFKPDGGMTSVTPSRDEQSQALAEIISLAPANERSKLTNIYTGGIILAAASSRPHQQREVKLDLVKGESVRTTELNSAFEKCDAAEREINPIAIGTLIYTASFIEGKLGKLETVDSKNSFTPSYVACIESAFRNFEPGSQQPVHFRISF